MPTRIVLKETTPPSQLAAAAVNHTAEADTLSAEDESRIRQVVAGGSGGGLGGSGGPFTTPIRAGARHPSSRASSSHRKVVGFRSSILREFSSQHHYEDEVIMKMDGNGNLKKDEAAEQRRLQLHLSNEDIRASPRLLGYLFASIASTVMLVSVVQFYLGEGNAWASSPQVLEQSYNQSQFPEDTYFHTINGPIYLWKLWSCIAVASAGTLTFLVILLMHFDTICFPRLWFQFFRDGSLAERNLLIVLLIFWAVSLHLNTSSLSVGEAQANVYFTTWIVFVCMALNYGVWRESADLPRLAMSVMTHHRETTYNWCWTLLFSLITAGAATDMFFSREQITLRLMGELLVLDLTSWMTVLGLVWGDVLLCIVTLFLNHIWRKSFKLKLSGDCRFILNWRFLEGMEILGLVAMKFWVILTYTGVDGVINGLNNVYFGVWGSFFNIVFTFGTWLRENKDIDYII